MTGTEQTRYDGQDLEATADLPNYTGWILDQFSGYLHGRVIEVGAGTGNVSVCYLDRVSHALLVEPADNLAALLRARVEGMSHVTVCQGLLQSVDPALLATPFDAAIMVNVLEHIHDDVSVLRRLHDLVRPGGAVCIFVPALPELYGTLDKLVQHERRYTRAELKGKLEMAGLEVRKLEYLDTLGIVPWYLAGKVFRRPSFDGNAAKLYDRVGVPLTRAAERQLARVLGRVPVGKSLVAVAVRGG